MNRDKERENRQPNPISSASFVSKCVFWWLNPLLKVGRSREIEDNDIYAVPNSLQSDHNTEKLEQLWRLELKKEQPSFRKVILKAFGVQIFTTELVYSIGEALARAIQAICLGGFVDHFAHNDTTHNSSAAAYWNATGIVISLIYINFTFHQFRTFKSLLACKIRVACGGLLYQKSLQISKASAEDGQNGQVISLLSNDLTKLDFRFGFFTFLFEIPMEFLAYFVICYTEIGLSAVIGMVFLLSFTPLQGYLGRKCGQLRIKNSERTDRRVKIMNEILTGIQAIKMYAWEKSFAKLVALIRRKEMNSIRWISYLQAAIISMRILPKLALFLSLCAYILFGNEITARKVFIISTCFGRLTGMITLFTSSLAFAADLNVTMQRIQEFLLKSESKSQKKFDRGFETNGKTIKDLETDITLHKVQHKKSNNTVEEARLTEKASENTVSKRVHHSNDADKFIRLLNATAAWKDDNQSNGIFDVSLEIRSDLCAIVGPVGSGKSTLLNVILGELELDAGTIAINGSISYASQEPWIFGGTVRSNIVFVEDFDEQRYNKVVEVCALQRDFRLLPQGDATIVGERGASLSGGQRARVNLARAVYKQTDIYLLDDPLSAVDAHVGKHIFEQCIKGFLANRICVLVTHQLQYLKNEQHVLMLNAGRVGGKFGAGISQEDEMTAADEFEQKFNESNPQEGSTQTKEDDPKDRGETKSHGSVGFETYKSFLKAVHQPGFVIFVAVASIVYQFAQNGLDFYLSDWVDWEESVSRNNSIEYRTMNGSSVHRESVNDHRKIFLIVYVCILIIAAICTLTRCLSFYELCVKASTNLHDMLFRSVSRAKMTFFNDNPSGRILNRFGGDISNVDSVLPNNIFEVTETILSYMGVVTITAIVNPWSLIPAAIMTMLFYILRIVFVRTSRSLKRIEASSQSPIYSHVNATCQGSSTIRVLNASEMLKKEFHEFQNHSISASYLLICTMRWFSFILDLICSMYGAVVIYSFLILKDSVDLQSGKVGLAILSSLSLINLCQWGMRQSAELENQMVSVERIIEYTELPMEPALESDGENTPPSDWPSHGNIEFKALSLRYSEHGARVLNDLTFRINAKEKIGVVGRTGAGKSSIIQSLFRLAHNEGQILIDGVDIGVIGLHDLRKKISIIPQEAVLFSSSIRFNLDPFNEHNDDQLWESLRQVELKSMVSALPDGIDSKVLDNGSNFSAGQRQLVCLARAILRNNKILILDEATANVDTDTDKLIQETIRGLFADCTVITIAHRLNTIMDCDKVLVVDAGRVVEFDHPYTLSQIPSGAFKQLLDQTGSSTASALTAIAKEKKLTKMSTSTNDLSIDPCDVDDIVISGIAGRFPKLKNINEFKKKLYNGEYGTTTDNDDNLDQFEKFDATFFSLNAEQAKLLALQSRMLLETVYECIVDAGFNPAELRCSNTGVFIGLSTSESNRLTEQTISSMFNFTEPNYAVDTSPFAMHRAVSAIRNGLCDSAIVGDSLVLSPNEVVANIFLQKARDARRVYASVVNIKTTVDAQTKSHFMEEVYVECGVKPTDVPYTVVRDIESAEEVNEVADLLCNDRIEPLIIGSLKSTLGNAEETCGLCAIIQALFVVVSGTIPANVYFKKPNPDISALVEGRVKIVDVPTPLNGDMIAINNFECCGSSHLILRRNPKPKPSPQTESPFPNIVTISGRTESAVNKMIDEVREHDSDQELLALIRSIHSINIDGHRYRGFYIQNGVETLREVSETPSVKRPVWYVFTGMATQWVGMGRSLMSIDVFRQSMERSAAVLTTKNFNLMELIWNGSSEDFENIAHIPPCIVAIQIALVDCLTACGIQPDGIVGHSMGELCCGYADGAFTAEQTILAAYFRGKCVFEAKLEDGRMAAVGLTWEEAKKRCPDCVYPACHNGIDTVAISGLREPLSKFVDELQSEGVFAKLVNVANVAFHSKYVQGAAKQLQMELENIIPTPKRRSACWISTSVPEDKWQDELAQYCSADYVVNNFVSPVLFYEALLHVPNNAIVVEIGPSHVISSILQRSFSSEMIHIGLQTAQLADNTTQFLSCLGKMYTAGVQIQLSNLYPTVSYPVGRGTPMISPFIEWDHCDNSPPRSISQSNSNLAYE